MGSKRQGAEAAEGRVGSGSGQARQGGRKRRAEGTRWGVSDVPCRLVILSVVEGRGRRAGGRGKTGPRRRRRQAGRPRGRGRGRSWDALGCSSRSDEDSRKRGKGGGCERAAGRLRVQWAAKREESQGAPGYSCKPSARCAASACESIESGTERLDRQKERSPRGKRDIENNRKEVTGQRDSER
ncbi:hypothetical protein MPTK1_3g22090 [Marchantia polymorpha subsp. ruderalis]|uniref:Uncharacterized protein n=2 Tax=Marchantia polymorpha TaxID=3197 RepID=A0AAF6B3G5_MARPO|nr:hypothetical protein MARPO_0089s0008 [Marchantia polymorpha]BBN06549.1 hypothetical protein Mp_3g22090 [Marchantia polymorpha subsp. ruderalis]|eukprot:PTQ33370.1 hypothetical protein MARPO_0089s0008 [Marchantia polymorpha]